MDINELFLACRRGDLTRVQYLVEQREVDLNVRDKWDSNPLYYACLCGHEEVVEYLLENGAKCEANTFDGERCLYGALNNEIRNHLKNYKAVTSTTIRRDNFNEFLRRTLERGPYSDITFIVKGEKFFAHRCILSARCPYFAEMLKTKWNDRKDVTLSHPLIMPWAFKAVLQYLYTARLEANIDQLTDIILLAKQCQLETLLNQLEDRMKKVLSFESTKPGVNVTMIAIEPAMDSKQLQEDLGILADQALPLEYFNQAGIELPFLPEGVDTFADIIFSVEDHHFRCHKVFCCVRSDYFKVLLEDHFGETSTEDDKIVLTLHEVAPNVFIQVLQFIYQDSCDELNEQNVYEVMYVADMYLLPGLKRICANFIAQLINTESVTHILRSARLFNQPRLEDQCAEFIAGNIEKVMQSEEFRDFVREDAGSVQGRQETDSIPIIDDIRFHITNFMQTFSDMYEADQKLNAIDTFLEELDLDA